MNDETATKLQALEALWSGARQRFEQRRSYEWKVSLALWTGLALLPVTLLGDSRRLQFTVPPICLVGTLAAGAAILHWIWLVGLWASYDHDRDRAIEIEGKMVELLQLGIPPNPKRARWRQWGRLAQPGFTVLLGVVATLAAWWIR